MRRVGPLVSRLTSSLVTRASSCQQCQTLHTYSQPIRYADTYNQPIRLAQPRRLYSDQPRQPLVLSDFPFIMRPSLMKSLRGLLIRFFIIKPYFDAEFDIKTFIEGAKGAIVVISNLVSSGQWDDLGSMVTPECLTEIQSYFNKLSTHQKQSIALTREDVNLMMPYETGIIMNDAKDNSKRHVEITIIGFARLDLEKELNDLMLNRIKPDTRAVLLNYRFIRDYSKGVNDSWTVNIVNHAMLRDMIGQDQ